MIFANPIAGRGRGERMARQIESRVAPQGPIGYDVSQVMFNKAADVPAEQIQAPCRAMVVIGGDGTIRATLQRVIESDVLHPIIPVPLGTANMMAKYLGIHFDESDLAPRISGRRDYIAPREACSDAVDAPTAPFFIQVAGVGFDAHF